MTEALVAKTKQHGCYVLIGDETLPVVGLLNADGDKCDYDEAVVAVAGPDRNGDWHVIEFTSEPERFH